MLFICYEICFRQRPKFFGCFEWRQKLFCLHLAQIYKKHCHNPCTFLCSYSLALSDCKSSTQIFLKSNGYMSQLNWQDDTPKHAPCQCFKQTLQTYQHVIQFIKLAHVSLFMLKKLIGLLRIVAVGSIQCVLVWWLGSWGVVKSWCLGSSWLCFFNSILPFWHL